MKESGRSWCCWCGRGWWTQSVLQPWQLLHIRAPALFLLSSGRAPPAPLLCLWQGHLEGHKGVVLPQVIGQRYSPHKDLCILMSHTSRPAAERLSLTPCRTCGEPPSSGSPRLERLSLWTSIRWAEVPYIPPCPHNGPSASTGDTWNLAGREPDITVPFACPEHRRPARQGAPCAADRRKPVVDN